MNTFIIELEDRPGTLADIADAIAEKGINITGVAGATAAGSGAIAVVTNDEAGTRSVLDAAGTRYREVALATASLENKPGMLAEVARKLANAGVNIAAIFPTGMEGGKITVAFGVDNIEAAKSALSQYAGVGA
ncbi:MAG TPA: ACT domain-containing protein [Candidatus Limnocylindrales bacterium]|nr:ACT domain-containing protein [Candidatus Limnocylindrales bacterium]